MSGCGSSGKSCFVGAIWLADGRVMRSSVWSLKIMTHGCSADGESLRQVAGIPIVHVADTFSNTQLHLDIVAVAKVIHLVCLVIVHLDALDPGTKRSLLACLAKLGLDHCRLSHLSSWWQDQGHVQSQSWDCAFGWFSSELVSSTMLRDFVQGVTCWMESGSSWKGRNLGTLLSVTLRSLERVEKQLQPCGLDPWYQWHWYSGSGFPPGFWEWGSPERGRVSLGHRSHTRQHCRCHFVYFNVEGVKFVGELTSPDILGGGGWPPSPPPPPAESLRFTVPPPTDCF